MNGMFRSLLATGSIVALSLAAQAEVLVYEGFPTGTGGYQAATGNKALKDASNLTSSKIVGFTTASGWLSGTGVIYSFGSGSGLSLPDGFDELPSAALVGDASAGAKNSGTTDERGVWRLLTDGAKTGLKNADKFHMRLLLSADSKALSALGTTAVANGGSIANLGTSVYGGGLVLATTFNYGSWHNKNNSATRSLSFGIRKNGNNDYRLSLVVMGTEDSQKVRVYDIISAVDPTKTYICYAEVTNNPDGAETIKASAQTVDGYSTTKDFDVETTANLIDNTGTGCPSAFNFSAGSYQTQDGYFKIDEFAVATQASDIMKLAVAGAPAMDVCTLSGNAGSYTVSGSVTAANATDAGVLVDDGETTTRFSAGAVPQDGTLTASFSSSDLTANRTYEVLGYVTNDLGGVTKDLGAVYTGTLTLSKLNDAEEYQCVPGRVTVSRANADPIPLTVRYALSSEDGTEGSTWEVPQEVVIPAGETSATLTLKPLKDPTVTEDIAVTLSLAGGLCSVGPASVELTLFNMRTPEGKKSWFPSVSVKASDGANWSPAGVPTADDDILVDGDIANTEMEWDAGVNGLPTTVRSWTQQAYTKRVTFDTTYAGDFTLFTVSQDATILSGSWSHPANSDAQVYRLNVEVGGNLTIAAGASIDVLGRGFAKGKYPAGSGLSCHACSPQGSYAKVYGNVYEPIDLGAGGPTANGAVSCGGGAVKLTVTGNAVINGTIDARSSSQKNNNNPEKGVGAGGSIWITAASISGSGTNTVSAYTSDVTETSYAEGGSGGRMALVATTGSVTIPRTNLLANGGPGNTTSGGGTIFVKDAADANGTLIVGTNKGHEYNYMVRYPKPKSTTIVRPGETWRFDRVFLRGQGILSVPPEATLDLVNGFESVSNETAGDVSRQCGILYLGGTIKTPVTTEHVISGKWFFMAIEPFTFDASVKLDYYAGFGNLYLNQPTPTNSYQNVITVNGDLTLAYNSYPNNTGDASGTLYANQRGNRGTANLTTYGAHGGSVGSESDAYDSVFHPKYSGFGGQGGDAGNTNDGSGAIKLTVTGKFTNNGIVNLNGSARSGEHHRGGAGALDLTCGSIETKTEGDRGVIVANGAAGSAAKADSSGGRIAIKLTDKDAVFDTATLASISAYGAKGSTSLRAAAGTVYLQEGGKSDGTGTILVKGSSATSDSSAPTVLPSLKWGNETAKELERASLAIEGPAAVKIAEALKFKNLTLTESSKLNLNGKTLTVNRATLAGTRLGPGQYAASDSEVSSFVTDASGEGKLIVIGGGLKLIVR